MTVASERVVVIGAGGHARVVVDIAEDMKAFEIAGFISVTPGESLYGYSYLGSDEALPRIYASGTRSALLAVGDNSRRQSAMRRLKHQGFRLITVISPGALVSKYATIGAGVAILPGAVVNAGVALSDAVIVNTKASVDHDCVLGECVHIGPGASLAGNVRLDEGVFLGAGTSVVPGISIGAWTVVGAGGVVTSNLPSGVVAIGAPARASRKIDRSFE